MRRPDKRQLTVISIEGKAAGYLEAYCRAINSLWMELSVRMPRIFIVLPSTYIFGIMARRGRRSAGGRRC